MFQTWLTFCCNLTEGFGILLIYLAFFAKEVDWNRRKILCITGVFAIGILAGTFMENEALIDIFILLLFLFADIFCTGRRLYNFLMLIPTLIFFTLIFVVPGYMLSLSVGISPLWSRIDPNGLLYSAMADIVTFMIILVTVIKCRKQNLNLKLTGWEIGGFCLYLLFNLFELCMLHLLKAIRPKVMIYIGLLSFCFSLLLLGIYLGYLITKRRNKRLENRARESEDYLAMQLKLLEMEKTDREEIRQLRHDLNNHLQVIQELCANKNYAEASGYAASLSGKMDVAKQIHMTGNQVADIVLSAKREEALSQGTRFLCEGDFRELQAMEPIDVCTILSNVLDNALEATSQVENGEIVVRGILHKNFYTLCVTNTVKKNITIRHNRIPTTKQNKHSHGIGLASVENVVKKYGGQYELSCEKKCFTVKVILTRACIKDVDMENIKDADIENEIAETPF
ncbi:MAG: sensor histidine kinase [Lachnospiraceae bacterium]